jgi:hypothetical protein
MRNVIRIHSFGKKFCRKQLNQVRQLYHASFGADLKTAPIPNMLFRPEEIHGASGEREVTEPFLKGDRGIGQDSFRFSAH